MRMVPLLAVTVCLGLSLFFLGGLGVSDYFGEGGQTGLEEEIAEQAEEDESLDPDEGDDGGGFFSFVVSGLSTIRSIASMMLFLPSTLMSFGVPEVVARGVGHGIQLVIVLGLVQVALQFEVK